MGDLHKRSKPGLSVHMTVGKDWLFQIQSKLPSYTFLSLALILITKRQSLHSQCGVGNLWVPETC